MEIEYIATWNFRNLEPGRLELSGGLNVLSGANGQGKTNVLEAMAVVGSLRSFRTHRLRPLARNGESFFRLEAGLASSTGTTVLELTWEAGTPPRRRNQLNGVEVPVGQYLQALPMVVVASTDRELVLGKPAGRRAFLDRLTFFLDPRHITELQVYRKLLQHRNAALGQALSSRDMGAWEERLADAGARVVVGRRRTLARLVERFARLYEGLGEGTFPEVKLEYLGESFLPDGDDVERLAEIYRKRYNDQRDRDRETGYTSAGPHRHDLMIRGVTGHVRDYLSAGQVKAVAAALRLSFLEEVEEDRGERLPLAIDDVDAEIDGAVTRRLLSLAAQGRQLVVTSTRSGLPVVTGHRCHEFIVRDGLVTPVAGREEKK